MDHLINHRRAAAVAILAGALCFTSGNLIRRAVEPGDPSPTAIVQAVQSHPSLWLLAGLLSAATAFLLGPAVTTLLTLTRGRGRRLVAAGTVLTAVGSVAAAVHAAGYFGTYSIYASGGVGPAAVSAMESGSEESPFFKTFIVLFMAGMTLGPLLLGIGLRRARLVPVWVPVAALVFVAAGASSGLAAGVLGMLAAATTFVPVARALVIPVHRNVPQPRLSDR
jgi:hypothetical protein